MNHYTPNGYATGWIRDSLDWRDYRFQAPLETLKSLPESFYLSDKFPPIMTQGSIGSCTANAWAAAYDYCRKRQGMSFMSPSRLFIYYCEREYEGTIDSDAGAQIRNGIKALAHFGAPKETLWTYGPDMLFVRPSQSVYQAAEKSQAVKYMRVTPTPTELMGAIASGHPVVFGFQLFSSFENLGSNGYVKMPPFNERPLGGHAVVCSGYFNSQGRLFFVIRNSWGAGHGDRGMAYFPAEYLMTPQLADDFWALELVEEDEVTPAPPPVPVVEEFYVGEGVRAKMREFQDEPATHEYYPLRDDGTSAGFSLSWGKSGKQYTYIASMGVVRTS